MFPQDSEILNRLISTNDFKLHLAISALYTVKYLKSDTYMKAATYIFYGPDFESESCSTESKDTYNILKPNNKLATDNQYNAKIKDRINDSQKTHQRLFYEITEISKSPYKIIARVRGIGVADITSTCGLLPLAASAPR